VQGVRPPGDPGPGPAPGTAGSHFSGDLFLAFSTGNPGAFATSAQTLPAGGGTGYGRIRFIPWGFLDPFYTAVVQGTEEAVANALAANEDMTGRDGHRSPALPRDRVTALFAARRRQGTP
jgi:L-aminopeptidase/D-esterase-like protein